MKIVYRFPIFVNIGYLCLHYLLPYKNLPNLNTQKNYIIESETFKIGIMWAPHCVSLLSS